MRPNTVVRFKTVFVDMADDVHGDSAEMFAGGSINKIARGAGQTTAARMKQPAQHKRQSQYRHFTGGKKDFPLHNRLHRFRRASRAARCVALRLKRSAYGTEL